MQFVEQWMICLQSTVKNSLPHQTALLKAIDENKNIVIYCSAKSCSDLLSWSLSSYPLLKSKGYTTITSQFEDPHNFLFRVHKMTSTGRRLMVITHDFLYLPKFEHLVFDDNRNCINVTKELIV